MSKPFKVVPIDSGSPVEPDSDLLQLIVGSTRHTLNLRTGEQRLRPPSEVVPIAAAGSQGALKKGLANAAPQSDPCPDRYLRQGPVHSMKRFSIDPQNEITVLSGDDNGPADCTVFRSEKELRKASDAWPASRLLEIWNGLSGVQPVAKLRDRATAVSRIWKHIQTLEDPGAPEAPVSEPGPVTRKEQLLALLRSASGVTLAQLMAATGWQKHSVRGFLSGAIHKKMGTARRLLCQHRRGTCVPPQG